MWAQLEGGSIGGRASTARVAMQADLAADWSVRTLGWDHSCGWTTWTIDKQKGNTLALSFALSSLPRLCLAVVSV